MSTYRRYDEAREEPPMSWDSFHRRGAVLRDVVAEAGRRGDGLLPSDVPGVAETFDDDFDLLATLQLRWHTRLAGQVERALSEWPEDPERAVVTAWRRTSADLAGVRAVLDRAATEPTTPRVADMLSTARRNDATMM